MTLNGVVTVILSYFTELVPLRASCVALVRCIPKNLVFGYIWVMLIFTDCFSVWSLRISIGDCRVVSYLE